MRKKTGAILFLAILLLLSLSSCTRKEKRNEVKGYSIYYVNKEETKVVADAYEPSGETTEDMVMELMGALETDAEQVNLKRPISGDLKLLDFYFDKDSQDQLILDFDETYYNQETTKEVLNRAAIVRTLNQIPGVNYVSFKVKGEPLVDHSGNPVGVMTADMFIDNTGNEINSYEKADLHLFFGNQSGDKLMPVDVEVIYSSNISMEKLVVENLIKGPKKDSGVYPTISSDTKIIGVTTKDRICYVNLNEGVLNQLNPPASEAVTVYSIVNSLCELANVDKVQISINGETNRMFRETVKLADILDRNLEVVAEGEVK